MKLDIVDPKQNVKMLVSIRGQYKILHSQIKFYADLETTPIFVISFRNHNIKLHSKIQPHCGFYTN